LGSTKEGRPKSARGEGSCPGVSATLATAAFDRSSLRWLEINLIAELEGPSFISRTVAPCRVDGQCS